MVDFAKDCHVNQSVDYACFHSPSKPSSQCKPKQRNHAGYSYAASIRQMQKRQIEFAYHVENVCESNKNSHLSQYSRLSYIFVYFIFHSFFPPPVLSGSGSLGRQHSAVLSAGSSFPSSPK